MGNVLTESWYGYYDGQYNLNRYFWSSNTKNWTTVPITDFENNEVGKRLAIYKTNIVVAEQDGDEYLLKIAYSTDAGSTWNTTSLALPEGDNLVVTDVDDDGIFWIMIGGHRYSDDSFIWYIYKSDNNGALWTFTGSQNSGTLDWPDDIDACVTKKADGTKDVYVTWGNDDWTTQHIAKFVNGVTYQNVYDYAPGVDIHPYARIAAHDNDWFMIVADFAPESKLRIVKNGSVVLASSQTTDRDFRSPFGDIRYSNGKLVACGSDRYAVAKKNFIVTSADNGDTWHVIAAPDGSYGYNNYTWCSIDIHNNQIVYVSTVGTAYIGDGGLAFSVYTGAIDANGMVTWALVQRGVTPFFPGFPSGHVRFSK